MRDENEMNEEYELIAPMVLDEAHRHGFSLGFAYAQLRNRLVVGRPDSLREYVNPDLIPQLDLLAMELGYTLTTTPHDEFWHLATFAEAIEKEQS